MCYFIEVFIFLLSLLHLMKTPHKDTDSTTEIYRKLKQQISAVIMNRVGFKISSKEVRLGQS
jgi:hypothetical protein